MASLAVALAAVAIGGAVALLTVPISHHQGSDGTCNTLPHHSEWQLWPGAFCGFVAALTALVLGRAVLKPSPRPLHHWSSLPIAAKLATGAVWISGIAVVVGMFGATPAVGNFFCNGQP
jgi:H+/Cl- antiporter ClcA